jgi:hypothetical protein
MIAPGAKGWIAKYLQLADSGQIAVGHSVPENVDAQCYNHHLLAQTGIVYGFPTKLLFGHDLEQSKWTVDEKLTVLLFESLLCTYMRNTAGQDFSRKAFEASLLAFYRNHKVTSVASLLGYLFREPSAEKLERILAKRVDVARSISSTKSWMSYLSNAFIYLDVVLFDEFLRSGSESKLDYQQLALLALAIISLAAYSDGEVEETERSIFEAFLVSADLDSDEREIAKLRFKEGTSLNELTAFRIDNWQFRRYLLDLSALTIYSNHDALDDEKAFLSELTGWLGLTEDDLDEALVSSQQFVIQNNHHVSFLQDASAVELMVENISRRWVKILGRNKDKLATELRQSKELVHLIRKSAREELSKEEKEKVKTQFMDIVKTMPALAIFLLPGGALLLPLVLRVIPTLVPSAFRDNE